MWQQNTNILGLYLCSLLYGSKCSGAALLFLKCRSPVITAYTKPYALCLLSGKCFWFSDLDEMAKMRWPRKCVLRLSYTVTVFVFKCSRHNPVKNPSHNRQDQKKRWTIRLTHVFILSQNLCCYMPVLNMLFFSFFFNNAWLWEFLFLPVALRPMLILIIKDRLEFRWFSEMLLLSDWMIWWIASFVKDLCLKDHTALCTLCYLSCCFDHNNNLFLRATFASANMQVVKKSCTSLCI